MKESKIPVVDEEIDLQIHMSLLPHQLADEIEGMTPDQWAALKELFAQPESSVQAKTVEKIVRALFERAVKKERESFYEPLGYDTWRSVKLYDEM